MTGALISHDLRRPRPGDLKSEIVEVEADAIEAEPDDGMSIEGDVVTLYPRGRRAAEPEGGGFYRNLAQGMSREKLADIAQKLLDKFETDKNARKRRDEQYEEGIRRTGLGDDAPGGAQFQGASKAVHPVMAEACVDFAASEMRELFPADGPTKAKIVGKTDAEKIARAERKAAHMNLQITEEIEEYRAEMEQMLTQVPLGGTQYMKAWLDESLGRIRLAFVPIDDVLLPFAATYLYTAERITEVQHLTSEEMEERFESGMYIRFDLEPVPQDLEPTKSKEATEKVEGNEETDSNEDGLRDVFESSCYLRLDAEDDEFSGAKRSPYLVSIDKTTKNLCGLYRNWEEEDPRRVRIDTLIEFTFIPWRGAQGIGLPHLIGSLSGAATGALRALLDSALLANMPTLLKTRGRPGGQTDNLQPTQVNEVDVPASKDIRHAMMPIPFAGPSTVLYQLLEFVVTAAKGVITTAEERIADATNTMPVGTTLALIEQGSKVPSSIHARMHASQKRLLNQIHRLNRLHLDDRDVIRRYGEPIIKRADYEGAVDIIPVSDPTIFSETQRVARGQAVISRADARPDLYRPFAAEERFLKGLRVDDIDQLLKEHHEPENTDAVDENASMSFGYPVKAFLGQDHLAHLITHLSYFTDPRFGASPLIAPIAIQGVVGHLREHLVLWYRSLAFKVLGDECQENGDDENVRRSPEELRELDKAFALATTLIHGMDENETPEEIKNILPTLQTVMQAARAGMQAMQPLMEAGMPKDPMAEAAKAETQRKGAKDQADNQAKGQELQIEGKKTEIRGAEAQLKAKKTDAEIAANAAEQERLRAKDAVEAEHGDAAIEQKVEAADLAAETRIVTNDADNTTALIITGMDAATAEKEGVAKKSNVTTGTGINPGPGN